MMPDAWNVMIAPPAAKLRDTLLRMADDAIEYRRGESSNYCHCPDHVHDRAVARDYEAARKIIASARGTAA